MTSKLHSGLPRVSEKFYRQLLFLYPRAYRNQFGHKMARTFSDCCDVAFQENGLGGLIGLWPATLLDMTGSALEQHVEQGLLSSRLTAIRVIALGMMVGSLLIFATEWDAENLSLLWTALLFAAGALGLFVSSPWMIRAIKRDGIITAATPKQWPQARSIPWAFAALAGLGLVDFLDLARDAFSGASYVQSILERYGPLPAFLVGALPRLVFYLMGLWLYRKGSAWAIVPALLLAVPRARFSDGAAILMALAVALTGVWVVLELRKMRQPKSD